MPHVGRRLIAARTVLFECPGDDPRQRTRHGSVQRLCRGRRRPENGLLHRHRRGACKRPQARRHLIEHQAEREQVGPSVELFPAHLLRRHVAGRADGGTDPCQVLLRPGMRCGLGLARLPGIVAGDELGDTEVDELRRPFLRQKDVGGLDVTVDDGLAVGRVQPQTELDGDVDDERRRDGAGAESARRCCSVSPSSSSIAMNGWPS